MLKSRDHYPSLETQEVDGCAGPLPKHGQGAGKAGTHVTPGRHVSRHGLPGEQRLLLHGVLNHGPLPAVKT